MSAQLLEAESKLDTSALRDGYASRTRVWLIRTAALFAEILGGLVLAAILAAGVLFWTLSSGPLSINFARPNIETALAHVLPPGYSLKIGDAALVWERSEHSLRLEAEDLLVFDARSEVAAKAPKGEFTFNIQNIFGGEYSPAIVALKGAEAVIIRDRAGGVRVGFGGAPEPGLRTGAPDLTDFLLADRIHQAGGAVADPIRQLGGYDLNRGHHIGVRGRGHRCDDPHSRRVGGGAAHVGGVRRGGDADLVGERRSGEISSPRSLFRAQPVGARHRHFVGLLPRSYG